MHDVLVPQSHKKFQHRTQLLFTNYIRYLNLPYLKWITFSIKNNILMMNI